MDALIKQKSEKAMKMPVQIKTAIFAFVNVIACSAAMAAEGEGAATGQSVFSGSLFDSIWTVLAFGLLVAALGKFAWKPLLNGLKEREERIQSEIANAENARRQAEKTLAEYNSRVEKLEQQGRQITEKAAKEAQKQANEIAEKARQEAFELKLKAKSDIEAAHAEAKEQLWREAGDMVFAIGSRILGRKVTDEDNGRLIRDAVEKLKSEQPAQGGSA